MRGPGVLGRIDVKPGPRPEIIRIVLARNIDTARAGIGCDDDKAKLCGDTLRARFDGEIFLGASQAGQPENNGAGLRCRLWGREDGKFHVAIQLLRGVLIHTLYAAKADIFLNGLVTHGDALFVYFSPQYAVASSDIKTSTFHFAQSTLVIPYKRSAIRDP